MNRRKLRRAVGKQVRLRPAVRRNLDGIELPSIDDRWLVGEPQSPGAVISIRLVGGGHQRDLHPDHIKEFVEPDILVLRGRLTLTRRDTHYSPMFYLDPALYDSPAWQTWRDWYDAGAPTTTEALTK